MPRSQFLADTLKTFLYSLSQGLGASAQARGRQGTNLGMAAALGAPMQLVEMERQRQTQEEERAFQRTQRDLMIQQMRQAARNGEIERGVQIANALALMPDQEIKYSGVTPQIQGGGTREVAGVTVPNPMTTPMPNPSSVDLVPRHVNIPEVGMVRVNSPQLQALQKARDLRQQQQIQAEFRQPQPFNTPGGTIDANNPRGGFIPGTTPTPEPGVNPALVSSIMQNPERYNDLTPTIQATLIPELTQRGFKFPAKPVDPVLNEIRQIQLQQLQSGVLNPAQFGQAQRLADDFVRDSKDFEIKRRSFETIVTAGSEPSAAGDLSMIFAFMKLLDPPSTVREGEQASAQNAAGVPDRIRNLYNQALTGQRLTPEQRADFINQAKNQYGNALKDHRRVESVYRNRAKAQKLPEDAVVYDMTSDMYEETAPAAPGANPFRRAQ